jgi:hypothetical protein
MKGITANYTVYWVEEGKECEAEVTVKLTCLPAKATGPSFHSAGEPAEAAEFEVVSDTLPPGLDAKLIDEIYDIAIQKAQKNLHRDYVWEPDA